MYLYPATMVLAGLWGVIKPFIDPRTREKVQIITSDKSLLSKVPSEYVPVNAGGTSTHTFDPAMYDSLKPGDQTMSGEGVSYAVNVS